VTSLCWTNTNSRGKKWINVHHAKEILLSTNEERYLHFGKENGEHKSVRITTL
jgi:hypothetical protein